MKMWVKKMNKHGMHLLAPGEAVATAVPSQPTGSMNGQVARQLGGVIGAAVAATASPRAEQATVQDGLADTVPNGDAVYVITDRRLAAISYTVLGGRPDELVGSFGFDQIAAVSAAKGRLASVIQLTFTDGTSAAFEVPRVAKPDNFVEQLQARIGSSVAG